MDQMECRRMVAGDLFDKSTQDPTFLQKIVTGDETFCSSGRNFIKWHYYLETKLRIYGGVVDYLVSVKATTTIIIIIYH
jgi:hypothetical protein